MIFCSTFMKFSCIDEFFMYTTLVVKTSDSQIKIKYIGEIIMKKLLVITLLAMSSLPFVATTVQAEQVTSPVSSDVTDLKDGGDFNACFGYRWSCRKCHFTSTGHWTYAGASKYAFAHQTHYGHHTVIFAA